MCTGKIILVLTCKERLKNFILGFKTQKYLKRFFLEQEYRIFLHNQIYKLRLSCKLKEKSENRDSYKFLCHLQYCFDIG